MELKYLSLLWLRSLLMMKVKRGSDNLGRHDQNQNDLINTTTEILKLEMNK